MIKPTSSSLDNSQTHGSGATDSPWQPSWWQWLISALSGTVEIEKQTAWHEQRLKELKKSNKELKKSNEELKNRNKRLAELESKLNEILHS
jgi:uncharacterized membrane protein (DUF106 family)